MEGHLKQLISRTVAAVGTASQSALARQQMTEILTFSAGTLPSLLVCSSLAPWRCLTWSRVCVAGTCPVMAVNRRRRARA